MLSRYLTFVSRAQRWALYHGVGPTDLVDERAGADAVVDVAASDEPVLWLACVAPDGGGLVRRVRLPSLSPEPVPWEGGRVGAVAGAPDGDRAVVLELPDELGELPRLRLWTSTEWQSIETRERPDISSALAWIGRDTIAYESSARQLAVVDLASSAPGTELGPEGSSPAAARRRGEWYAISGGDVLAFPRERPFESPPRVVDEFSFGTPSRVRFTNDGEICTWTEPRFVKQVKGYVQTRNGRRRRLRELNDGGIAVVVGPFEGIAA